MNITGDDRYPEIDPIKIFKGLTLRGTVENIWGPQEKALIEWHENRGLSDIAIEMNTGGGKSLVGLLIAQSLSNETKKAVLYVCPTIQLVEQTAIKAEELGLSVATYTGGKNAIWTNKPLFDSRNCPCITNYAAVFNGISIFRRENPQALIFDDAHTAADVIRSAYTLQIPKSHVAFKKLANLFRNTFVESLREQTFDAAMDGDPYALLYVPSYEVVRSRAAIIKQLNDLDVPKLDPWAWEHLKEHLHCCMFLISGVGIEITPPILPVRNSMYFDKSVRRVYMTGTMPLKTEFLRTFGTLPQRTIKPDGKSGEAQKLFLLAEGDTDEAHRASAKSLITNQKACIIVPSGQSTQRWSPPATVFKSADGHGLIETFSASTDPLQLLLVARFDGIDLPGRSCRVLILDGMPQGSSLYRSFLDRSLNIQRLRTAHTGIRIAQAIGRIFRSNTDHGAVIIVSHELQRWLLRPEHLSLMPELLQRQVKLGFELRKAIESGNGSNAELLNMVLGGDAEWDTFYSRSISQIQPLPNDDSEDLMNECVLNESIAFHSLWNGQFSDARDKYSLASEAAESGDEIYAAWLLHWSALCSYLLDDRTSAQIGYTNAANVKSELGRPRREGGLQYKTIEMSVQSRAIVEQMFDYRNASNQFRSHVKDWLSNGPETAKCEEALSNLGTLLGFRASRPDKEHGTGPDVLWLISGTSQLLGLEAKTEKESGEYRKKEEIGQIHDHATWLNQSYPGHNLHMGIVGEYFPVSKDANPPDDLRILPINGFAELGTRIEEVYVAMSGLTREQVEERIEYTIRDTGLKWPQCWKSIPSLLATDLQGSNVSDAMNNPA